MHTYTDREIRAELEEELNRRAEELDIENEMQKVAHRENPPYHPAIMAVSISTRDGHRYHVVRNRREYESLANKATVTPSYRVGVTAKWAWRW